MGIGGLVIFQERYTLYQWLGLGILTWGFALFFHEQLRVVMTAQTTYLLGNLSLVIGAVAWAIYALIQKQLLQQLPSSSIMLIIYGGATVLFTFFATPQKFLTLSALQLGMLIFAGLNTLMTYSAFAEALEHWEASKVSAILALTPLVTIVGVGAVSWFTPSLITPEHLTVLAVLGAMLVVVGSIVIAIGKK
jgi:drug/metabolite transporter (DMT)-like permease